MFKGITATAMLLMGASWTCAVEAGQKEPLIQGTPLSQWLKEMEDKDVKVRQNALLRLYNLGPAAKPAGAGVLRALKDTDLTVRRYALFVLSKLGPDFKEGLPAMLDAMKDADQTFRAQAASIVAVFGADAVPGLMLAVKDPKHPARTNALYTLSVLGPEAEKAADELVELLGDQALGAQAANVLDKIGAPAAPALLKAADKHPERVFPTLGRLKVKEAVPLLTKGVASESENLRQISVQALSAIGPDAAPATTALIQALKDKNDNMRMSAIEALGKIGPAAKEAVAPLSEHIKPGEVKGPIFGPIAPIRPFPAQAIRFFPAGSGTRLAVEALINIGVDAPAATPALMSMLKSKAIAERQLAVSALGVVGKNAIADLVPLGKDADAGIRVAVAQILGRVGGTSKEAIAVLGESLSDTDARVVQQATQSLGRIGAPAKGTVPLLIKALTRAKEAESRILLVEIIGMVGSDSKQAVAALGEALYDADANVSQHAATALGRLGAAAAAAVPDLQKTFTTSQDSDVRAQAAQALGDIGPAAVPAVADLVKGLNDDSEVVRQWAAYALGGIGPKAKDALPRLTELQRDRDPFVRRAASRAVTKIRAEKN